MKNSLVLLRNKPKFKMFKNYFQNLKKFNICFPFCSENYKVNFLTYLLIRCLSTTSISWFFSNFPNRLFNLKLIYISGDAANRFLNENWREAFKTFKYLPEEAFGKLLIDISNRVYSHFPAEELYPE